MNVRHRFGPGTTLAGLGLLLTCSLMVSALSAAEWVAPSFHRDESGRFVLSWTNLTGTTCDIEISTNLANSDWRPLLSVTADSQTAVWTDEAPPQPQQFYRVENVGSNWCSKLQKSLDQARKSQSIKGASAVVITKNGIWQGTSGLSETAPTNSIRPDMRFSIGSFRKRLLQHSSCNWLRRAGYRSRTR